MLHDANPFNTGLGRADEFAIALHESHRRAESLLFPDLGSSSIYTLFP